ncbi:BTAD domain-containing putative transcriptional regulator [Amycolatopsis sp. cmx-11-51]|uniref:BTAD domain-containing putative transcriptional regulator n=1 Tax=unclassified Amycolatopsis TaxID=2618356 RepID=UPI0039E6D8AF
MRTEFRLLGEPEVLIGGERAGIGHARQRAVLIALLADVNHALPPDELVDRVWGEQLPQRPRAALYGYVSRLRGVLAGAADVSLRKQAGGYVLEADPMAVDLHRFRHLITRARAETDDERALALYDEAMGQGHKRPVDLPETPWLTAFQNTLDSQLAAARLDRDDLRLRRGRHAEVVEDLTSADPHWDERRAAQLMLALHRSGRQGEALAHYEQVRARLAEELGVDPGEPLRLLHHRILTADPALAPAPPLPAPLTTFVGRDEELDRVRRLLARARLVTLTGPGGTGKTRLALEAARQGDARWVELAPLTEGTDVAQAVADAVGLHETSLTTTERGRPLIDRLTGALSGRRLLLVLDNCEHLVDDVAALVVRLLTGCGDLRILVTSRTPLDVTGELLCPVPPLPLPPTDTTAAAALEHAGVRLFADRAAAGLPGFSVDEGNVGVVLRICRTLDGLPLALELAAARVRALSLADLAAGLDDRFALLSRGRRAAEPRHRTLRAAVAWSWELLEPHERRLAARLSVFSGRITAGTAKQVCGSAAEALADLADKSLLHRVNGPEPAYRMLNTLREFCAEQLAESGEQQAIRTAHLACFLRLSLEAQPHLLGKEQVQWLRRLDAERDNLNTASRWALETEPSQALQLFGALSAHWWLRGGRAHAARFAADLVAAAGPVPPSDERETYALCLLTDAAQRPSAADRLTAAESLIGELGRPAGHPLFFLFWGRLAEPGHVPAVPRERLFGADPWGRALLRYGEAFVPLASGDVEAGRTALADAQLGFRALGERWGTALTLSAQAGLAEPPAAVELLTEAVTLAAELGCTPDQAILLCQRAACHVRAGEFTAAEADYDRAGELAKEAGAPEILAEIHRGLGEVARRRGDLAGARRLATTALDACSADRHSSSQVLPRIYVTLGLIARDDDDPPAATEWFRRALAEVVPWDHAVTAEAREGLATLAAGG